MKTVRVGTNYQFSIEIRLANRDGEAPRYKSVNNVLPVIIDTVASQLGGMGSIKRIFPLLADFDYSGELLGWTWIIECEVNEWKRGYDNRVDFNGDKLFDILKKLELEPPILLAVFRTELTEKVLRKSDWVEGDLD